MIGSNQESIRGATRIKEWQTSERLLLVSQKKATIKVRDLIEPPLNCLDNSDELHKPINISTGAANMPPPPPAQSHYSKPSKIHLALFTILASIITNLNYEVAGLQSSSLFQDNCNRDQTNVPFERVEPMVVIGGNMGSKNAASNIESMSSIRLAENTNTSCPDTLKIYFSGFGDRFVIDLVKNKRLISDRYFKISNDHPNRHNRHPDASPRTSRNLSIVEQDDEFYRNHKFLNLHNFTSNEDHCHYHGFANDHLGSMSAISIVRHKLLSGFFLHDNEIYYLHANTSSWSTVLTKTVDISGCNRATDLKLSDLYPISLKSLSDPPKKIRTRRFAPNRKRSSAPVSDNTIKHYPYRSNASSLYVEMLIVHDHSQFKDYKGNTSNIAERTMQIVNIMNAFYKQLNIFVSLVGVVLWVEKDEIELTEDGDSTLTNFLKYRYEKLLPKYHHDNAQLITSTSFNGSVVGKALKGPICTHEHSGGVNTDHSHSPAIVAVTLAHELGHNLGMEHDDEDKCKCPDEKCIMSSSSNAVHPKHWSSCSIEHLDESRKHGLLDCLTNRPEKVFGPVCGNGFVEEGEDCDVGEPIPTYGTSKSRKSAAKCLRDQDCARDIQAINPCCNRQTCKLIGNATCAQGACCDLSRCSVYNATETKVCRQRQSECDLEEICDGKSEFCPQDVHYHDGIECDSMHLSLDESERLDSINLNRTRAYCYKGRCASHESQCQLLWGPSGSVSKDICFEQNVHANASGNCGYNRRDKTYDGCEPEDAICGMLHCVHNLSNTGDLLKAGKLSYGFESSSIQTRSYFTMSNQARIYCTGATIDAGQNHRDPGLVPNGAACDEDKMCANQRCVSVHDIMYDNWCPSDCNGNGICDNLGICHCNDGTIGTSCYQFFGSNFHLSLILYIFVFFIPMIVLIVYAINHYRDKLKIWWFLHTRMSVLREKARLSNQQRRLAPHEDGGHAGSNQISISEPIPLKQRDNSNRPFYEPASIDPWTETSIQVGKSIGFRLDPIKPKPPAHNHTAAGNLLQSASGANNQVHRAESMRPVRAAPPPPVPPHAS